MNEAELREKLLLIMTNAIQEAEMRAGCTNHSWYANNVLKQIEPLIRADESVKERKKTLAEATPIIDKMFEALSFADFSNGVEEFGMDEGRVRGYELVKELEAKWNNLKSGKPVKE
jgi:hypothetical protein